MYILARGKVVYMRNAVVHLSLLHEAGAGSNKHNLGRDYNYSPKYRCIEERFSEPCAGQEMRMT